MTNAARLVLQDARYAIRNHTDDLGGESFRVSWFAVTGLLRAVGHVLAKVDSTRSPQMALAIDTKWSELQASKPNPLIFWSFIESERNRFLKSYEHSVYRSLNLAMYDSSGAQVSMVTSIIVSRSHGLDTRGTGTKLTSIIDQGPFKGESERRIAELAINWWEGYLDEVDEYARFRADGT
ncbi:hypothetical protein SAMN05421755_11463 [Nitrosomonas sp. Nm33]|nr:hypothetical protein SAMN05421755_11463 [Nitrosomonas sp. Nm33]